MELIPLYGMNISNPNRIG